MTICGHLTLAMVDGIKSALSVPFLKEKRSKKFTGVLLNAFSRRASGFDRRTKRFELSLFLRKSFFYM